MTPDFTTAEWLNEPARHAVDRTSVSITTDPGTDLWQRTFYGFRNDNAPALLLESRENFTFTARARFAYEGRFDQCGLLVYESADTWFKASIEYEDREYSRLGSVVTNAGYSDWATVDIASRTSIWYRLSRRGPDFLLEQSFDGDEYRQMRVFHLHSFGETTAEMGRLDPPAPAEKPVRFGLYACSPLESSFQANFDGFVLEPTLWKAHA